jgi:hypothetical protein
MEATSSLTIRVAILMEFLGRFQDYCRDEYVRRVIALLVVYF